MAKTTELVLIIDKSGSMAGLEDDTVGGINATLDENRRVKGDCNVSVVLFDHGQEVVVDHVPIEDVRPLVRSDYRVGGCTALLDAVGDALLHHEAHQEALPRKRRADHMIFVIVTDGQENASRRHDYHEVSRLVGDARRRGWEFLFLGANIDVAREASRLGIDRSRASRYVSDACGSRIAYEAVAKASCETRTMGAPSAGWARAAERDARRRG